jgi:hypothetical protein
LKIWHWKDFIVLWSGVGRYPLEAILFLCNTTRKLIL